MRTPEPQTLWFEFSLYVLIVCWPPVGPQDITQHCWIDATSPQQCRAALSLPGAPEDQVTVVEAAAVVPLAKPQPEAVGALRPALLRTGAGAWELSQVAGPLCCHVCKGDQAGLQQNGTKQRSAGARMVQRMVQLRLDTAHTTAS